MPGPREVVEYATIQLSPPLIMTPNHPTPPLDYRYILPAALPNSINAKVHGGLKGSRAGGQRITRKETWP